ncbi:hypothetical protein HYC85_031900 [Camellia sinensis]|uniref:Uncharacterized protein n=1 Tax=Camellia sinensis TaxID=4442 RepID=A0A7J7FSE0_CAMSI|nr:hypothetical protein HYC85_031900 [Camellia sinensis]
MLLGLRNTSFSLCDSLSLSHLPFSDYLSLSPQFPVADPTPNPLLLSSFSLFLTPSLRHPNLHQQWWPQTSYFSHRGDFEKSHYKKGDFTGPPPSPGRFHWTTTINIQGDLKQGMDQVYTALHFCNSCSSHTLVWAYKEREASGMGIKRKKGQWKHLKLPFPQIKMQ